jgi:hypothetical protein
MGTNVSLPRSQHLDNVSCLRPINCSARSHIVSITSFLILSSSHFLRPIIHVLLASVTITTYNIKESIIFNIILCVLLTYSPKKEGGSGANELEGRLKKCIQEISIYYFCYFYVIRKLVVKTSANYTSILRCQDYESCMKLCI